MQKKSSLIEILRFLFALVVLKNHGYLPDLNNHIGGGKLSVEFFFMVGGFLLFLVLEKAKNNKPFEGTWTFLKKRLLRLGIPFVICVFLSILRFINITDFNEFFLLTFLKSQHGWLNYLWFVVDYVEICLALFILRTLIKNDKVFYTVLGVLVLACSVLRCFSMFYSSGYIRAVSSIGIGVFMALIPTEKIKQSGFIVMFIISFILAAIIVVFPVNRYHELGLYYLVYPFLILSGFRINFSNKVFNYLGGISFGIYIYQTIGAPFIDAGYDKPWILTILIIALAVIDDLIKRLSKVKTIKDEATPLPNN